MTPETSIACGLPQPIHLHTSHQERDISSFHRRLLAWCNLFFVDHGFFRTLYLNCHALPGGLYRSAQPSPNHIRRLHRKYGIRTIVNLRSADGTGRYALEAETCRELGITLVTHFGIRSRGAPEAEIIQATQHLFNTITYPALIHCKSGADRVGFASALYRIFRCGENVETAMSELSHKYGHIKGSKTGILDFFFTTYLASGKEKSLLEWVAADYNRSDLKARFKTFALQNFIVDKVFKRE